MAKDFTKSIIFLVTLIGGLIVLKTIDLQTGFFTNLSLGLYKFLMG